MVLEDEVHKLFDCLKTRNWRIATAESCTGGLIGQVLTAVPGSSAYYDCGFITYSNEAKMRLLDVHPVTIEKFGAVSEQCARLMARGAYAHSDADIAVSVTGIAGPGGGSVDKPVGLVYIGLATADNATVFQHLFNGDRESIRFQTAREAIGHAIRYLSS